MAKRRFQSRPDPLTALLRSRVRHLLRGRSSVEKNVLRLMPLLWTARFRSPPFDVEAPGIIAGLRRSRWGRLCEQVGLRAPVGLCAAKPLVASLLLLPSGQNLEIVAMPVGELSAADQQRFSRRLLSIGQWLASKTPHFALSLGDPATPLPDAFWSMGALLCGLSPKPRESEECGAERALDRLSRATGPMLQTVALLVSADTPPFSNLLAVAAGTGAAKQLRAPDDCLAAGASDPSAQRLIDATRGPPAPLSALVASAREIRAGALRSMRQLGRQYREQARPTARSLGLDSRWPTVLREQLRAATDQVEILERMEERGAVVKADDVTLSAAGSWVQARLESLPAVGRSRFGASWAPIAAFLDAPSVKDSLMVVLAGAGEMSLWVRRGNRSRARARLLLESELVSQVARAVARGAQLTVHALPSADRPLAAKLSSLAAAARSGWPSAIDIGDKLLVMERGRVRHFDTQRYLSRPRRVRYLPASATELAALKPPRPSAIPVVHAHVFEASATHVFIYYLDSTGSLFRERCERASLEAHLSEGQQLLRDTGAVLSVTVSQKLIALGGQNLWPNRPTAELSLGCRWPLRIRFSTVRGEELSWAAAAQTVLSHWPVNVAGRVRISRVFVKGPTVTPLTLLWLRASGLTRLEKHLADAVRPRAVSLNERRIRADEFGAADNSFARHPGEKHAVHSFQHRLP